MKQTKSFNDDLRELIIYLHVLSAITKCSCMTKTPVITYHNQDCKYRIVNILIKQLETLRDSI